MKSEATGIIASGLTKAWNAQAALPVFKKIGLEIKPGEFVGIYGPNGSGKTTLLYVLSHLESPDQGSVRYTPSPGGCRPAFVFQDYRGSLFNWLNVFENIALQDQTVANKTKSVLCEKVEELLNRYGLTPLEPLLAKYPYELSGGQCQMVAIARALFAEPNLLFLDEPFSALDIKNRKLLLAAIQELWCKRRSTILLVSHEIDDVLLTAQRLLLVGRTPMQIISEWKLPWPLPREQSLIITAEFEQIQREVKSKLLLGEEK